jgi:uncharacterized protein YebE (UPF0316 family)
MNELLSSPWWAWGVMPILIFLARMTDVSLSTVRAMLVLRGFRKYAPIIGFFEALIWILAVSTLIKQIDTPLCYVAYAGGFAMGNYMGFKIDGWLGLGTVMLRVITNENPQPLMEYMRQHNWGMTVVDGHGYSGDAYLLLSVVKRKDLKEVIASVHQFFPNAFYITEDVKLVTGNIFN